MVIKMKTERILKSFVVTFQENVLLTIQFPNDKIYY